MFPQPDSQSFTRLLTTLGIALCVTAFVVPGLVIRNTQTLVVSQKTLNGLTPLARQEMLRRQRVARDAGSVAVPGGGVLLAVGIGVLSAGLWRLRRQEQSSDTRVELEIDELRGRIRSQTASEQEESLARDVSEALTASAAETSRRDQTASKGKPVDEKTVAEPPRPTGGWAATHYREVEREVLKKIALLADGSIYEFWPLVRVRTSPTQGLLLDGLLLRKIDDGSPDLIVDIKLTDGPLGSRIREFTRRNAYLRESYTRVNERPSRLWLIVVVSDRRQITATDLEHIEEANRLPHTIVTVVPRSAITSLELPEA